MRFARFALPDGGIHHGIVEGEALVELEGDLFGRYGATERIHLLSDVDLLPPVAPSKIIGVGVNFKAHAREMNRPLPAEPKIFLKPPSALIGQGAPICLPAVDGPVEHEAELAVVIGRIARGLTPEQALPAVFGYTCLNDVTARKLQAIDGVFARAKGFDTFAPAGPWIESDVVLHDLVVQGWVNGERRQHGPVSDLIFDVPTLVSFISRVMTLLPGDIISLGTPAGVGPLEPGDEVEVRIDGVGRLINPVQAA